MVNENKIKKEKLLQELLKKESSQDEEVQHQINIIRSELDGIHIKEAGAIIRSRIKWHEEGERNTAYFYNVEKQNATKNNIRKLMVNKKEITNQQEILKITEQYYKELYSSKQTLICI